MGSSWFDSISTLCEVKVPEIVWRVYTPTNLQYAADTLSADEFDFLESEINRSKTSRSVGTWDMWIKSPFDFPLPVAANYSARFLPSGFHRNAFYSALSPPTSVFETAYHHLQMRKASRAEFSFRWEERRIFSVGFDAHDAADLRQDPEVRRLMDGKDYSASQHWARDHPDVPSILYPSARDPQERTCVCIYEISRLDKKSLSHETIAYAMQGDSIFVRSDRDDLPWSVSFPEEA